mgnify:CR=1 FL=1
MNRTEAIARTRLRADDKDAVLASETEVEDALRVAQEEVWHSVVESGANLVRVEEQVSAPGGGLDLASALSALPMRILGVAERFGATGRQTILPGRDTDALTDYTGTIDILVSYIPRAKYPDLSYTDFSWGDNDVPRHVLDELMCCRAAQIIKMNEAEINPALERRIFDLEEKARSQMNLPGFYAMPLPHRAVRPHARMRYVIRQPYTLQLVW